MAKPCGVLTFLTDFGTADTFVGEMKGAALSVSPALAMVDLTHEIPPQDVETASFRLAVAYRSFPPGTVHVAVVDPGVGTARRALAVETESHYFVAPDNGLLSGVLEREPVMAIHAIENPAFFSDRMSATFEGRDRFAPAAAWIASGTPVADLGPRVDDPVLLAAFDVAPVRGSAFRVPVRLVDRFGNAALDLTRERLEPLLQGEDPGAGIRIETPGGIVETILRTYAEAPDETPFALFNSSGYLELAVRDGDASRRLGLRPGMEILVTVS